MTDFNLRAAKIQFRSLIVVLIVAILIATGITTGSFVLSFDALREFGRLAESLRSRKLVARSFV